MTEATKKQRRGFACMSLEKRTEIARKGGAAVPADKRSFSTQAGLAESAGRKGGEAGRRPRLAQAA
jgi:general stress protein YciG